MAGTVTLRVVRGYPKGTEYTFSGRAVGAVGRGSDCLVRLPNDLFHMDISRYHCVLDVDPPEVQVRDLGSRNGTFVNGARIGQRPPALPAEEALGLQFASYPLRPGDEITVGSTVFRVETSDLEPEDAGGNRRAHEAMCLS